MKRFIIYLIAAVILSTSCMVAGEVFTRPKGDTRFRDLSLARQPLPSAELDNELNVVKNFLNNSFTMTQNISEWALFQNTPTYISSSSFTVNGDSTTEFHVGRAIKANLNGTYVYSRISTSAYSALTNKTTVTISNSVLTSSLTAIYYGVVSASGKSQPIFANMSITQVSATKAIASQITAAQVNADDVISKGPVIDVRAFSSFSTAKASSTTAGKTILIAGGEVTANTITVASDRAIKVERGGSINVASGKTLTLNGSFEAGKYQVFTGTGSVEGLTDPLPEWFGTTVNRAAHDYKNTTISNIFGRLLPLTPVSSTAHYGSYDETYADDFTPITSSTPSGWLAAASANASITLSLPRVVIIGDSISEGHSGTHGRLDTGGTYPTQTYDLATANSAGQIAWHLERLLRLPAINQGIGNTTLPNTITRWGRDILADGTDGGDSISTTATLSRKADYIYLHCGVNDVATGRTAAQIKADFVTLISSAQANSIPIIVDTVGTYSTITGVTDPKYLIILQVNNWLKNTYGTHGENGVLVTDYYDFFKSPTDPSHGNIAGGLIDGGGVHPTKYGYQAWSKHLFELLGKTDFIKAPNSLILYNEFNQTNHPVNTGRPQSAIITTDAGYSITAGLDNTSVNNIPVATVTNDVVATTITVQMIGGIIPVEKTGDPATYVGFGGIGLTDIIAYNTSPARNLYEYGTFTFTGTGFADPAPTGTASYARYGNMVIIDMPQISGTSNATTFTLTGLPAALKPSADRSIFIRTRDNAGTITTSIAAIVSATGVINVYNTVASTGFTASGTKTIEPASAAYTK